MRRREFLVLAGATAAWPLTVYGQGRVPLVLVWFGGSASDPEMQRRHDIVRDSLRDLGWIDGRNRHYATGLKRHGVHIEPKGQPFLVVRNGGKNALHVDRFVHSCDAVHQLGV